MVAEPPNASPARVLKQVTILFMDVVGSTALAGQLDPEDTAALMDEALARGTAIVGAHQGRVLQYAGDNILAAFGADAAREDDAERAVHCGLALVTLGRTMGSERQGGPRHAGFAVRVGIHTGSVLLGGGVDPHGSIRGLAVNIAARMEQSAPAGALRISHDTYAQVRGLFEVQAQPPLPVKGVDEPMPSWLVQRAKPRQSRIGLRGIEGVATRMVGRDAEMEVLQAAFRRLFVEPRLAAVTVVADAGIGKSRLLHEFAGWSEARPETFVLFRGRATPQTARQAYGVLRDILAWRCQIADDDSIDVARRKLEDGIVPLFVHDEGSGQAEAHAHLLGHLIGIEWNASPHLRGILDDPKQIRNRAFHAAADMFRRLAAAKACPVVLQVEDLHWADSESLDFLDYLVEVDRDVPLLLLACTRPTLFERRADWRRSDASHRRIELGPLDSTGSAMLATELLMKLPEAPAALRGLLVGSAEGSPYAMEELLRMLIDQRAVLPGEPWTVNVERLVLTRVPTTLTGVLQARLDGLPAAERRALQQASIVGAVFWEQALAAVDASAAEQLSALVQRELVLARPDAAPDGLREYAFRHQLLHQVTYDTVLKASKREGHARVARWLADRAADGGLRAGDLLGVAAEHFEQAGDAVHAAEWHARAAEQAVQRLAHASVLAHAGRGLALLDPASPQHARLRWRLLAAREHTFGLQARRDEQAPDLAEMAVLAGELGDARCVAEVAMRRALRAMRMADWTALESASREGLACARNLGDDALRLNALRLLASARQQQGDPDLGRGMALEALADSRRLGLRGVEARLLNVLSVAAEMQGDLATGLELTQQGLAIYRDTGDRVNEAIKLASLGRVRTTLGDRAQARRDLEAALVLLRANGDRVIESMTLVYLAALALQTDEETRALSLARAALELAQATRAPEVATLAQLRLAEAELALGRVAAARQCCAEARARALAIAHPLQHDASAGLARVELAAGDVAAALAALQPVLLMGAGSEGLAGTEEPRRIEWTCHRVLASANDPRAGDWLARAHAALMAQAGLIPDPALRHGFLHGVAHHREIVARCTAGV